MDVPVSAWMRLALNLDLPVLISNSTSRRIPLLVSHFGLGGVRASLTNPHGTPHAFVWFVWIGAERRFNFQNRRLFMKARSIARLGAGMLFLVFGIAPVFAQSARIVASIPFDFTAGNIRMAAGAYQIESAASGVILLRNQETRRSAFFMAIQNESLGDPVRGQLLFTRYGDAYFLNQVDWPGYQNGLRLLPGKVEVALARNQAAGRVAVAVKNRN